MSYAATTETNEKQRLVELGLVHKLDWDLWSLTESGTLCMTRETETHMNLQVARMRDGIIKHKKVSIAAATSTWEGRGVPPGGEQACVIVSVLSVCTSYTQSVHLSQLCFL